jgi:3-oxoacyl-(acyl-carrier-protein) synthase
MFESWKRHGKGAIPGEGSVFILLESERCAIARNRKCYARICHYAMRSVNSGVVLAEELTRLVSQLDISQQPAAVIAAGDGDVFVAEAESEAMERAKLKPQKVLRPRAVIGDLYAASATAQLALGARLAGELTGRQTILVNCFGCGSEQGCFILEAA